MQNPLRTREQPDPRSFAARKGHLPQLSISDDNHHVTEAIGYMYGEDDSPSSPRSSGGRYSIRSDKSVEVDADVNGRRNSLPRKPIPEHKMTNGSRMAPLLETQITSPSSRRSGWDGKTGSSPVSPLSARESSPSETATTQFPLNDIDYESSPAAVAQELSNLQALRRMSMDVGAAGDPDLPQLNAAAMPSAPSPAASEDDSARLFWVPARLHPELAPKEFKSFLESKAEQIKRRSGELSSFSSPMSSRSNSLSVESSTGSLRRRKSMLSKEFDSPMGYQDGADILEWKKTREQNGQPVEPNLEELESLVSGGARLSLDNSADTENGDVILPSIPGSSLKRSTRTKYQRPESRKGPADRSTYAERAKRRAAAAGSQSDSSPITPTIALVPSERSFPAFSTDVSNLASTLMDPYHESNKATTNFSRPGNRSPSPPPKDSKRPGQVLKDSGYIDREDDNQDSNIIITKNERRTQNGSTASSVSERQIPQIIESPPQEDHPVRTSSMVPPPSNVYSIKAETPKSNEAPPPRERPKASVTSRPGMPPRQSGSVMSTGRPSSRGSNMPPQTTPTQTLEQPSPLPGHDNNTSNLSFIPTLTVDKRQEQKKKEEKKSGWSWLRGKEEQDKEKDKDKSKTKATKASQSHDSTRLDVLQTSIDGGPKGRESLVLDRESLKLEEERRKESQRKSSGEKKEKESLFSSIFGGKKSKAEKDAQKRAQERLSPEPPYRELKPDIDYNWTRFSILEERTIYRMAHIKLANPRRALYSQVLLSNFMYSYLAKVQQMHPQMNLPTSAKQQRKQKEQQLQQQQQQQTPDEFAQYQRYQQQQAQQGSSSSSSQPRDSTDGDSNTYDFNYSREPQRSETSSAKPELSASPSFTSERHQGGAVGKSYTTGRGGESHVPQMQPQQRQYQQQQRAAPGYRYDDDDDDDEDMW